LVKGRCSDDVALSEPEKTRNEQSRQRRGRAVLGPLRLQARYREEKGKGIAYY